MEQPARTGTLDGGGARARGRPPGGDWWSLQGPSGGAGLCNLDTLTTPKDHDVGSRHSPLTTDPGPAGVGSSEGPFLLQTADPLPSPASERGDLPCIFF